MPQSLNPLLGAAQAPEQLLESLQSEAANHASDVLHGILHYLEMPCEQPDTVDKPVVWQAGSSRLLDYGAAEAQEHIVLFVPSLINRYYILDLDEKRSLLNFLSNEGQHPFVLDWGAPCEQEYTFGCEEYIQQRLLPAVKYLYKTYKKPVVLAGYCMGGVLALAAAQLLPKQVGALALFATPWDFHCKKFAAYVLDQPYQNILDEILQSKETVPAAIIQGMFTMTDPWVFEQKYRRFNGLDKNSEEAKDFVVLERWVNDGVPMSVPLARDCLIGWAQENRLQRGEWNIAGTTIAPSKVKQPTLIAIPQNDHVVPYDCATALLPDMPHARVLYPDAGHVSMVVGSKANGELWKPMSAWASNLAF